MHSGLPSLTANREGSPGIIIPQASTQHVHILTARVLYNVNVQTRKYSGFGYYSYTNIDFSVLRSTNAIYYYVYTMYE